MKFRKKPVVIEAVQFDKRMDLTSPDAKVILVGIV